MTEENKDLDLTGLLLNRELSEEEKEKRFRDIKSYLTSHGGIIVAASCKNGILLAGASSNNRQTIFKVYHRLGLLSVGRQRDCDDIHKLALISAYGTVLELSKDDLDPVEIKHRINKEIEQSFSCLRSGRGAYKANSILVELGPDMDSDIIQGIVFSGNSGNDLDVEIKGKNCLAIYEAPLTKLNIEQVEQPTQDASEKKETDEKTDEQKTEKNEKDETFELAYRSPVTTALITQIGKFILQDEIWTVEVAALLVGLILRLLDARNGRLEMAYLDRTMLRKAKSESRYFHNIWRRITRPDPQQPSNPWIYWEYSMEVIRKEFEKSTKYPEFKRLFELYDVVSGKTSADKAREIMDRIKKEGLDKLVFGILGIDDIIKEQ